MRIYSINRQARSLVPPRCKIVVVNENMLGVVHLQQPYQANILGISLLKGADPQHNGQFYSIRSDGKDTRLATLADFETFRVHSNGFLKDFNYDFIRE